ncbi:MAG: energy-coupling factor transporter transmembrane protein EcfT [Actinobacteria bacterium]|nr:energy-coupling factor transporter transmembrane protein EcfT [Actinomycetota bacterium]
MQFFEYIERDSVMHSLNPVVKLVSIFLLMLAVTFVYEPYTPLIFSVLAFLQIIIMGRIPVREVFKMILPLILVLAGITITSIIAFNTAAEITPAVLFSAGRFIITVNSVKFGLTIGLRTLFFLLYSMLFVITTDPTDFIISLIRQLRLPARVGFGTLAGYRFVPLLGEEYRSIHQAHRIRGLREDKGAVAKFRRFRKYAVPLMVTATRKAQRVAIAMDSKCFYAYPERTYLREVKIRKIDIIYSIIFGIVCIVIFLALRNYGLLAWGYRSLR